MATEAQIAANRNNAQASTGPRTVAGKTRVSRNAATFGIYSAGDVVRPDERRLYHLFCEGFHKDLAPQGAMEITLAAEITHAAWRLRRCAEVESAMDHTAGLPLDPMIDPLSAPAQNAVDRARAQALRAASELRRIQTERQVRAKTVPEDTEAVPEDTDTITTLGLASCKDMAPILRGDVRRQLLLHKLQQSEMLSAVTEAIHRPVPAQPESPLTKQTQSAAPHPRNSPCPCGSGVKYKRCCGPNAPAILSSAA